MDKNVLYFCTIITVFIIIFTIVYSVSKCKHREHFDPIDNDEGYESGMKLPDATISNVSILSNFNVKTPMKCYNGETETLTIDNATGDITGENSTMNTMNVQKMNIKDFNILDIIYPVGCIYQSFENKNPQDLYGFGVWEPINDVFLWAGADSNIKGGSKLIKMENMPSHNHSAKSSSSTVGNHNHWYKGPSNKNGYPNGHDDTSGGGAWHEQYWAGNRWVGNNETTSDAGSHNHTISTTIGYTGGGKEYMPPYQTVFMWKRLPDPEPETDPSMEAAPDSELAKSEEAIENAEKKIEESVSKLEDANKTA